MFQEEDGPAETAIRCTDQFFDAGIAKLDASFGAGYAAKNPQALAAYVAACAQNVDSFMAAAAAAMDNAAFDDALAAFDEDLLTEQAPKPKGRRR